MNKPRPFSLIRLIKWIRLLLVAVSVVAALLGKTTHSQPTVQPTVAPVAQPVGQSGSASTQA